MGIQSKFNNNIILLHKNIIYIVIEQNIKKEIKQEYNEENVILLLEKAKDKLIQYASTLCGLINDEEENVQSSVNYEEVLQSLINQDYLQQLRNERLQQCIINELKENQNEWRQEDRTETLFEITDRIFEDLINEVIVEIQ